MSQPPEFAEERRARIVELVNSRGRVKVSELAKQLQVTQPTIRRDIVALETERKLKRTHGGALATRSPAYEVEVEARRFANAAQKEAIAQACLPMLGQNDSIFLDAGTTSLAIAEAIADEANEPGSRFGANLNVLTNSVSVARTFSARGSIHCSVVGGQYRPIADSFVGPLALQAIRQFTVNVAFLGVTGMSGDQFSVADLGEADVKRAVLQQARRIIVPMDHSKLGLTDFVGVFKLADIDIVIVDKSEPYFAKLCDENDVRLILASNSISAARSCATSSR
ncbi:DeoR/GlpR transcriptional regulator [Mycolicibacterium sp. P9-64]|uniref:DeoR/GlpR family DNA-binding transcription regulator n=1 Tax=Mycolicibacterium sp. P9-64 TaxID=2024612 RepID=UPI0011EE491C|nr:DeoR/GlpR family DNA-binding transcription regulator [Mycolicibacterium sp. P9-64]KAA0083391.1 DeoR/GlpR transcriptional regulator [Mycolicibacterium sp. P9-64]